MEILSFALAFVAPVPKFQTFLTPYSFGECSRKFRFSRVVEKRRQTQFVIGRSDRQRKNGNHVKTYFCLRASFCAPRCILNDSDCAQYVRFFVVLPASTEYPKFSFGKQRLRFSDTRRRRRPFSCHLRLGTYKGHMSIKHPANTRD